MHNTLAGLGVIVLLLAAILWTIAAFRLVSKLAAALMLPYLAWVAFATALNAGIYVLNG
jgi:tryptophan-rich sensory protein